MTSSPPAGPAPQAGGSSALHLSDLVNRVISDRGGEPVGRLRDVIVRLRGNEYPLVTGLVAAVEGREVFVPVGQLTALDARVPRLGSNKIDLRWFERREGEVLLRADILGHRLIDVQTAQLVRAADLELAERNGEWVLIGVDTRRRPRRILGMFGTRPAPGADRGGTRGHAFGDWSVFEPLIGHAASARARGPFGRIRRLKPAQIADLIEDASKTEESEILGQVHADPELEADVFEELDEDRASRLLGTRSDAEIAGVLSRMRADDAADAIAELPQPRRQPILDLLPSGQRTKVMTLMGFNPASAGGLMGVEFLALPPDTAVAEALTAAGRARSLQPEALVTVHAVDQDGHLMGVASLIALLQSDPAAHLDDICDPDPVRIGTDTDVVDVAVLMSDYNLITIPVVDDRRRMLGVITVDDVLEATLPPDWRRREAAQPPDAHYGDGP